VLKEKPVAFFSHRHAAYCAGLGNFGVNNMLLTPEYGPRVRFTSILTTAELPADPVLGETLCTRCMRCMTVCPVKAIPEGDYPQELTDKKACAARSEELFRRSLSPCGCCIKVCPVGKDRGQYGREDMKMYDDNSPVSVPYRRIQDPCAVLWIEVTGSLRPKKGKRRPPLPLGIMRALLLAWPEGT